MVTNRTPVSPDLRWLIGPEAVRLFTECRALEESGAAEVWEDDDADGRRGQYLERSRRLDRALGRSPWDEDVLDIFGPHPPEWMREKENIASWRSAWALRRQLEQAARVARTDPKPRRRRRPRESE